MLKTPACQRTIKITYPTQSLALYSRWGDSMLAIDAKGNQAMNLTDQGQKSQDVRDLPASPSQREETNLWVLKVVLKSDLQRKISHESLRCRLSLRKSIIKMWKCLKMSNLTAPIQTQASISSKSVSNRKYHKRMPTMLLVRSSNWVPYQTNCRVEMSKDSRLSITSSEA